MELNKLKEIWKIHWRSILLVTTPLVLLPLVLIAQTQAANCAFVIAVMCTYWVGDVLPLAAVSFIPIFAFPMFGLLDTTDVCNSYMNESNFVLMASLIAGIALQRSRIHKRIALLILLGIGANPRRLLLGVMLVTTCLSTLIMDVATCTMMIPVVDAIVRHLDSVDVLMRDNEDEFTTGSSLSSFTPRRSLDFSEQTNINNLPPEPPKENQDNFYSGNITEQIPEMQQRTQPSTEKNRTRFAPARTSRFEKALVLSVAYSSAIGGLGTLTGNTTNLVFKKLSTKIYGNSTGITYTTWMMIGFPTLILAMIVICAILQIYALGIRMKPQNEERNIRIKEALQKQYTKLGALRAHEISVSICIVLLACLLFFRDTAFMDGWGTYFEAQEMINDAVPAVLIIFVMCALPVKYPPISGTSGFLVKWESTEKKLPWDILILQGGAYSIASAAYASGLTEWLGTGFSALAVLPLPLVCWIMVTTMACISEFLASSSLAAMVIPVAADLSETLQLHPFYLMLPITFGASLGFILPISSVTNAIAYKTGKISIRDMVIPGLLANVTVATIVVLVNILIGSAIFQYDTFPIWASNRTADF